MSYCVNCGVELRESESHCPLCDTRVVNPRKPYDENAERAYPVHRDVYVGESRLMTVILITLFIMIPSLTCLIVEYVISGRNLWSLYVVCGMCILWTYVVPPFLIKRGRVSWIVLIDTISLSSGLWIVEKISGSTGWFIPLALPIILSSSALILVFIGITKFVILGLLKMISFSMYFVALLIVVIEVVTDMYISNEVQLQWSLIVFIPIVLLATVFVVVDRKRNVKEEMKKKLHI